MNLQNMKRSELTEQIKLFNWMRCNQEFIPELALAYHIQNEGKRSQGTGKLLKAAGVKKGVPDICIPVPRQGFAALYIELKFGDNRATKEQKEFIKKLRENNTRVEVAYGAEEAREIIRNYLKKAEGFDLVNCEEAVKTNGGCDGDEEEWKT